MKIKKLKNLRLSRESVEQFNIIVERNNPSIIRVGRWDVPQEKLYRVAGDICAFFRYFTNTQELIEFLAKSRKIVHAQDTPKDESRCLKIFLKRVERVADFYHFHEDRGGPVRDRRVDTIRALLHDTKTIIEFLRRRIDDGTPNRTSNTIHHNDRKCENFTFAER